MVFSPPTMATNAVAIRALAPRETVSMRSPFIVSPGFDALFFFGSVASVAFAWLAAERFHVDGFYVLAAVAVISNGPHLASTWTRVYFDRREWVRRPMAIFAVPAFITALVVGITLWSTQGGRLLNSVLLYWATWHFVSQNWGLLRLYQRHSGEPESSLPLRLERPLLYASVFWCLLHRIKTGPRNLLGWDVIAPDPPWALVNAVLAVVLGLATVYLALRIRQGFDNGWLRALFLLTSFLGFAVPFLLIHGDGTTAFAAAACWHGLQYLGIVRFYNRNAWRYGVSPHARIVS